MVVIKNRHNLFHNTTVFMCRILNAKYGTYTWHCILITHFSSRPSFSVALSLPPECFFILL